MQKSRISVVLFCFICYYGGVETHNKQKGEIEMKIVKETLTACINRIGVGAPKTRFLVIEEPINLTGICKAFETEEEAQAYLDCVLCKDYQMITTKY